MNSSTITALSTTLLVIVGIAQIGILRAQRRQSQLALIEEYRRRWRDNIGAWGIVVFIGRDEDEYYQVLGRDEIESQSKHTRPMHNFLALNTRGSGKRFKIG